MKKCSGITGILLLVIIATGNIFADPMKFTDIFDAGHEKMTWLETVSWEFDIKEDGFDPLSMKVIEASIELAVEDDKNDPWFLPGEFAILEIGESQVFMWEVDTDDYKFEVSSLLTLNENGILSASLTSALGDFYFNSATLTALATPEPNIISMICFSLLGLLGLNLIRKVN